MGMKPDQSKFLGPSVGLQLDESPVVAAGFDPDDFSSHKESKIEHDIVDVC